MGRIKTYARIKPNTHLYPHYDVATSPGYLTISLAELAFPDFAKATKLTNRQAQIAAESSHRFKFKQVFDHQTSQEQVYETVAKDIVNGFLEGYNGTIFAYGQTGSGKTYTVEGTGRLYSDRGLAPRTLSHIYDVLSERQENEDIEIHVSYMEIYQDIGYDLLNSASRSIVQNFPKVVVLEGPGGGVMVRNLTQHLAPTENVAQNLLLQGQANRHIAETPMNQRSSRSHAIFTIAMKARKRGADIYTRSKLHLVDLAGSERVSKTGVEGQQLAEAKFINLSLHHLEGVIIALQGEASSWPGNKPPSADLARIYNRHVPYRNSLLTMVLRDSLGGNCLTAMIATINLTHENLGESVSTCRFAQRVACISNAALKNEKIDDRALVRQLRKQIAQLNSEITVLKTQKIADINDNVVSCGVLEPGRGDTNVDCVDIMNRFLAHRIKDPISAGITSPAQFRECLHILRALITQHFHSSDLHPVPVILPGAAENHIKPSTSHLRTRVSSAPVRRARSDAGRVADEGNILSTKPAETNLPHSSSETEESSASPQRKSHHRRVRPKSSPVKRSADATAPDIKCEYKSPYEQQRQHQIEKLGFKVEQTKRDQQQQRHHLAKLRNDVKLEELQLLHNDLSKKIELNKEKIAEQHAYLLLLKQGGADSQLIEQETLAQFLLQKRQGKMEARLEKVREQLDMLQNRAEKIIQQVAAQSKVTEQNIEKDVEKMKVKKISSDQYGVNSKPPSGPEKKQLKTLNTSLEEKFSEHVNKNGKLNSRKVYELLQNQNAKQDKKQKQLERDKIVALTQQVALKETSTRLKLQEFQNMLKLSREQNLTRSPQASTMNLQGSPSQGIPPSNMEQHRIIIPTSIPSLSDTDSMYVEDVEDEEKTLDLQQITDTSLYSRSQISVQSDVSHSTKSCYKPASKKNPKDMWESRYSNHSLNSIPTFDVPRLTRDVSSSSFVSVADSTKTDDISRNDAQPSFVTSDISAVNGADLDNLDRNFSNMEENGNFTRKSISNNNDSHHNNIAKYNELCNGQSDKILVLPSTTNSVKLDAYPTQRRKTFDSVLSSMLGEETERQCSHGNSDANNNESSISTHIIGNQYDAIFDEDYKIKREILNPQISASANHPPESIENRLASFLDMDVPAVTASRSQNLGQGHEADMDVPTLLAMHKLKRLISGSKDDCHLHSRNSPSSSKDSQSLSSVSRDSTDDFNRSVCKIKALPEPERENTYMSKIQQQKQRVARIRKAQKSAEIIQRTWKNYRERLSRLDR